MRLRGLWDYVASCSGGLLSCLLSCLLRWSVLSLIFILFGTQVKIFLICWSTLWHAHAPTWIVGLCGQLLWRFVKLFVKLFVKVVCPVTDCYPFRYTGQDISHLLVHSMARSCAYVDCGIMWPVAL